MTENLLQYLISLPLTVAGSVYVLYLFHLIFSPSVEPNILVAIGCVIFVAIVYGSFWFGDTVISRLELLRSRRT